MASGTIKNQSTILNTARNVRIQLTTQSGWTIGNGVCFRNTKPTIISGAIIGERALTTEEVNAFNSVISFNEANHEIVIYTTNTAIANLTGKTILLNFA